MKKIPRLWFLALAVVSAVIVVLTIQYLPLLTLQQPQLASFLDVPPSWTGDFTFSNASLGFYAFFGFFGTIIALGFDILAVSLVLHYHE